MTAADSAMRRRITGGEPCRAPTAAKPVSAFARGITRYQWLVFFVVWAGWTLDAADFGLYSLVLQPALREFWAATRPRPISARLAVS